MAPEQKAGKEVTVRSDLYSLGLVLHEMFTGKRAEGYAIEPAELVKDLDPAIERVILRCLEEDPKRRPGSALNVAMALPGGDPIAAALAAGETPSPEMVAASQEKEGLSARNAWFCFFAIVVMLAASGFRGQATELISRVPLVFPPDVLAFKAQETLKHLGYADAFASRYYGFGCCDDSYVRFLERTNHSGRDAALATGQPAVIEFWYRQHRADIRPEVTLGSTRITYSWPAPTEPGMIRLTTDTTGRLVSLEARPDSIGTRPATANPDVSALFSAAGLDPARFHSVVPEQVLPMTNDAHLAWIGTYADGRAEQVRLEAAFWEGRPVFFSTTGTWRVDSVPGSQPWFVMARDIISLALAVCGWVAMVAFAWRNIRLGRGDRKAASFRGGGTASRFGVLACRFVASDNPAELVAVQSALALGSFVAAFTGGLYLAVEPHVRRNWPDALISWSRLLTGQTRNALVASHVLVGLALKLAIFFAGTLFFVTGAPRLPQRIGFLDSGAASLATLFELSLDALLYVVSFILTIVILRLLLRRLWIADLIGSLLLSIILTTGAVTGGSDLMGRAYLVLHALGMLWLLRRFGLLALLAGLTAEFILVTQPLIYSTWYTTRGLLPVAIVAVVATWALWVIVSDKRQLSTESAA